MCFENLYFHILLLTKYNLEYTIRIRPENILKTFSIKILISNCHSIEYNLLFYQTKQLILNHQHFSLVVNNSEL